MAPPRQHAPTALEIEAIALDALRALPEPFRAHCADVPVLVEEWPDEATLDVLGIDDPYDLTGVYHGRPIGEAAQTGDAPTTIRLFRRPILDEWVADGEALDTLVQHIVVHEVGHHFGLSDEDMHALEQE